MIKFDKIKLVTNISDIEIIDSNKFHSTVKNNIVVSAKMYQEVPYLLIIKFDYEAQEVIIEFTGKILGAEYKKLISADTIAQCFTNINNLGFCRINIEGIITHAEVVKCDVTLDAQDINITELTQYIRSNLKSYRKYQCSLLANKNLIIDKNVTTKKFKKRMTIYDKGKEMRRSSNIRFAHACGLQDTFDGICRFELNLNSKEQIRNALNIESTSLESLLASRANPILDFMKEIVSPPEHLFIKDKQTYTAMLVLKDNDYDLAKVEALMRGFHKRGTNINKIMEQYRSILSKIQEQNSSCQYQCILDKLS